VTIDRDLEPGQDDAPARVSVVVVAAGDGRRLGVGRRKAFVPLAGRPLVAHALDRLARVPEITETILVVHADDEAAARALDPGARLGIVCGGATRGESVLRGVRATDPAASIVLVHDAARPHVEPFRVSGLIRDIRARGPALLVHPADGTVKHCGQEGRIEATLDRNGIRLASTPQGAARGLLLQALEAAAARGLEPTDEAQALEGIGQRPWCVPDDPRNFKITTREDLMMMEQLLRPALPRIGHGYDLHRFVPGDGVRLGGVQIPAPVRLLGHSDADALLHALIDALLGAAGLPDIGEHFPDTDPRWKGADSSVLLERVLRELADRGLAPWQVDSTLIAEQPRLGPHKEAIRASLARLLRISADRVGVKARTGEGLDAIGRGEALAVHAVALVLPASPLAESSPC
jgi:2-C-methyl-D-erythritol 4-phosphate cytidylyltransferase/2-C-methyl-D-erythritol 2,4-cyclodiphosphate synthase